MINRPDEQDLEVLLELDDALDGGIGLVGERDAHEGGGEQAGLMLQFVRHHERGHHDHEGDRIAQKVGHEAAAQDADQGEEAGHPHAEGHHDFQQQPAHHLFRGGAEAGVHLLSAAGFVEQQQRFEDEHGQDGADRVDRNALPLRHGADASLRADVSEQGHHHRRARDGEDGPRQHREADVEVEEVVGGPRRAGPRHQNPHGDEVAHGRPDRLKLGQAQAEAPLEEDDPDRDGDEGKHPVALQRLRIENPENGAGQEAAQKQQEDGGKPDAPGQPLRTDAENDDRRDVQQDGFGHGPGRECKEQRPAEASRRTSRGRGVHQGAVRRQAEQGPPPRSGSSRRERRGPPVADAAIGVEVA